MGTGPPWKRDPQRVCPLPSARDETTPQWTSTTLPLPPLANINFRSRTLPRRRSTPSDDPRAPHPRARHRRPTDERVGRPRLARRRHQPRPRRTALSDVLIVVAAAWVVGTIGVAVTLLLIALL